MTGKKEVIADSDRDYTDEELQEMLSPEEYEALKDADSDEEALDDVLNGDEENQATSDSEGNAEIEEADPAVEAKEDKERPSLEAFEQQEENQEPVSKVGFGPRPDLSMQMPVDFVEDFDTKVAEIDKKLDELTEKLDNAEISLKEWTTESRKLQNEQNKLAIQQQGAIKAQEYNEQLQRRMWEWEVKSFLGQEGNQVYSKSDKLMGELDRYVKLLANDPENANKEAQWFLQEAHAVVKARYASEFPATTGKPNKPNADKRTPDLTKIPKTLANLPSAEMETEAKGEFDYLDDLDPEDFEREVARITRDPAKYERYLNS